MNVFFLLGRTFLDQSLAIAKEFRSRYPNAQFSALVSARRDTLEFVHGYKDPEFKRLDWHSDLDSVWLTKPLDRQRLEYYRCKLGNDALQRLIISDREIGRGYISCGSYADTPVTKALQSDDEARWSYMVSLLDYLFDVFEQEKPDFVFSYCIAASHELAMQMVAESMGITFAQPVLTKVRDYFIKIQNNLL